VERMHENAGLPYLNGETLGNKAGKKKIESSKTSSMDMQEGAARGDE